MTAVTRALTVKQPYADLIVAGVKDVENRSWEPPSTLPLWHKCRRCGERGDYDRWYTGRQMEPCPGGGFHDPVPDGIYPFRLAIHAGKKHDRDAPRTVWMEWCERVRGDTDLIHDYPPNLLWADGRLGALLGTVPVTEVHHADTCMLRTAGGHPYPPGTSPKDATYCSRWAEPDCFHWTMADPTPLSGPIPAKGQQGLWRLDGADLGAEVST